MIRGAGGDAGPSPQSKMKLPSTKPYLIRAIHEWCNDNGFTPHLAVVVDKNTVVPREYVRDGQIVLNVGFEATKNLAMGNETISFVARFGGVARDVSVPLTAVAAIYAKENGAGMSFEIDEEVEGSSEPAPEDAVEASPPDEPPTPPAPGRPYLQRVK